MRIVDKSANQSTERRFSRFPRKPEQAGGEYLGDIRCCNDIRRSYIRTRVRIDSESPPELTGEQREGAGGTQ